MPSIKTICDSINQTAPFLFLSLLLATNGLHYYVIRNGGMDRDDILLHNFSLGIALAGTYLRDSFPRNTKLATCSAITTTLAFILMPKAISFSAGRFTVSSTASGFGNNHHHHHHHHHLDSCSPTSGTHRSIKWDYYPSRCDDDADLEIPGAVYSYLDRLRRGDVCATWCVRLGAHAEADGDGKVDGGSGWLRIGHASAYDQRAYCGPGLEVRSCVSFSG